MTALFRQLSNRFKVGCDVTQIHRRNSKSSKENHRPGIFYRMFQKFIKSLCLIKCMSTLLLSLQNSSEDLKCVVMLKTAYCPCSKNGNKLSARSKKPLGALLTDYQKHLTAPHMSY